MKQLDSFRHLHLRIHVCLWVRQLHVDNFPFRLNKIQSLMYLLSNDFGSIHTSKVSQVADMSSEMILLYNRTLIQMTSPLFHWFTPVVYHSCGRLQTSFIKLSQHWPPQHTKLGILWLGPDINLCHSRATADSQAHSSVFCGEFGTNFAKYLKPEGFYYCRPVGLWWTIWTRIQIYLTEFHQDKATQAM